MKVWITKYALTIGIEEVEADVSFSENMVAYGGNSYSTQYAHGNDWHGTKEAAIKRAENMRQDKLISLQKSIEKMQKLRFK